MKRNRLAPPKDQKAYRQLWRVVDGAVLDALSMHPDYLTPRGKRLARRSITKRVTGAVLGFAEQSARAGLVSNPAAENAIGDSYVDGRDGAAQRRRMASSLGRRWGRLFSWSV